MTFRDRHGRLVGGVRQMKHLMLPSPDCSHELRTRNWRQLPQRRRHLRRIILRVLAWIDGRRGANPDLGRLAQ